MRPRMGGSLDWTATAAAFMAMKPTGGMALHLARCTWRAAQGRSAAEDGEGRLICFAMERRALPAAGK